MNSERLHRSLADLVQSRSESIKAILLFFVVADHNDWFRQLAPDLFRPMTFHVLGFFLLAFSFSVKPISWRFVVDRIARYLVPFWIALSAATIMFSLLVRPPSEGYPVLITWLQAAILGNAPFVKLSSGLLMLWFLPSLFGVAILIATYNGIQQGPRRILFIAAALIAHLVIPLLPRNYLFLVPFGLAIGANIFVLGLFWRHVLKCHMPYCWGPMALSAFALSYGVLVSRSAHLEIATLDLAGVTKPWLLLLQDISGVAGVLTVAWVAVLLPPWRWLGAIGRYSLVIYLAHPVVYLLLSRVFPISVDSLPSLFLMGCFTTGIAVCVAYLAAALIANCQVLSNWITPRSWDQWRPVKRLRT